MRDSIFAFVLGYNQPENSIECLESLRAQDVELDIAYVDNGSEPANRAKVMAACPFAELIPVEQNEGFTRGWNAGLDYAREETMAEYVFATNNDVVLAPDCVRRMRETIERDRETGLVTPRILYHAEDRRETVWCAGLRRRSFPPTIVHRKTKTNDPVAFREEEEVDYMTLCTVLGTAETFRETGPLDPDFFIYSEDTDYSVRASELGFRLKYNPDAKVWHKSDLIGKRHDSDFTWFHLGRSEALFMRKHPGEWRGLEGRLHVAYLMARTLVEGGKGGWKAYRRGWREGMALEPVWCFK